MIREWSHQSSVSVISKMCLQTDYKTNNLLTHMYNVLGTIAGFKLVDNIIWIIIILMFSTCFLVYLFSTFYYNYCVSLRPSPYDICRLIRPTRIGDDLLITCTKQTRRETGNSDPSTFAVYCLFRHDQHYN